MKFSLIFISIVGMAIVLGCSAVDGFSETAYISRYDDGKLGLVDESGEISSSDFFLGYGTNSKFLFGEENLVPYVSTDSDGNPVDKEKTRSSFELANNIWNSQLVSNFPGNKAFQAIFATRDVDDKPVFPLGWFFVWPRTGVIAFPTIIYGHRPWSLWPTNTDLVEHLDNIDSLSVDLDIKLSFSDLVSEETVAPSYNLGLEVWLYDTDVRPSNVPVGNARRAKVVEKVHEFHIWLRRNEMSPAGSKVEENIALDGMGNDGIEENYFLYDGPGPTELGDYTVFVLKPSADARGADYYHEGSFIEIAETVDIKAFLVYARDNGYFDYSEGLVTDHVGSIEFGTELQGGEGIVSIYDYKVNLTKTQ